MSRTQDVDRTFSFVVVKVDINLASKKAIEVSRSCPHFANMMEIVPCCARGRPVGASGGRGCSPRRASAGTGSCWQGRPAASRVPTRRPAQSPGRSSRRTRRRAPLSASSRPTRAVPGRGRAPRATPLVRPSTTIPRRRDGFHLQRRNRRKINIYNAPTQSSKKKCIVRQT